MKKLIDLGKIPGLNIPEDALPTEMVVVCQTSSIETAPSCDTVAQTYVQALGGTAPHSFSVLVGDIRKGAKCMQMYASDGTPGQ